ncbi:MAG: hypothetical protein Q9222_004175 [Ikaeria aurantiellina]
MLAQGLNNTPQSNHPSSFPHAEATSIEAEDQSSRQEVKFTPLTPFPTLTGLRPSKESTKSKSTAITSSIQYHDLQRVSTSNDVSPSSLLQVAWAIILSAYCGVQENIAFATATFPLSGHGLDSSIPDGNRNGFRQLCLDIPGDWVSATGVDLVKSLAASETLPLDLRNGETSEGENPQIASRNGTLIAERISHPADDDWNLARLSNSLSADEHFAFSLMVSCSSSGLLLLEAVYTDSVLDESGALMVLSQYNDILVNILPNPAQSIRATLAAICPSLQSFSNLEPKGFAKNNVTTQYLHSQFEHFAHNSPSRVALEWRQDLPQESGRPNLDVVWTYSELNARADAFAQCLIYRFGSLSDMVVPICMDRCPELYVAVLGILKSGGAWCPVDSSFPPCRRYDLIARADARMVVVVDDRIARESESIPQGVEIINVININHTLHESSILSDVQRGNLAYLMWTSGTTGDPKGVPIHHEAAMSSMKALQNCIPANISGSPVRCLQFSHFTFDVFIQDLFYTWGVGGTVISSTREIMLGSFAELANRTNASHAHLTPAFATSVPRQRCHTLKVITMIGEKLPQAVADDWSQDMQAFNTYGPAEAAVVSTYRQFGAPGDQVQSDNIGFPLPSVSAFVLRNGIPVSRHAIGELALGGPQVSTGYWKDPDKTSDRFVWNEHACRRLYMTGDMVRQLADGSIQFIGREDDLIKIQGIRVELSEISFNLRSCHPLVEQVDTQYLSRKDRPSKVIVSFLAVPQLDHEAQRLNRLISIDKAAPVVKSAIVMARDTLPDYMVPRVFLVINRIPQTSSAKIDRLTLQKIYNSVDLGKWEGALGTLSSHRIGSAAWDHSQSKIIAIVAELSGTSCNSMSRFSDLRSIGIDSITATKLAPSLDAAGFSVSISSILQCGTLDDLLNAAVDPIFTSTAKGYDIESFHEAWYDDIRRTIGRDDFLAVPALPLQESVLSESMQNLDAYWSSMFFILDIQTDLTCLQEAWKQVVRDTDALRTGFLPAALVSENKGARKSFDTNLVQLIYANSTLQWYQLSSTNEELKVTAAQQARKVAAEHQKAHFRDPPIAVTIIENSSSRLMMISIHHSIRDEASLDFILPDVDLCYHNGGRASNRRHQFRDALPKMLPTSEQITLDEAYWSKTLKDFVANDTMEKFPDLTGKSLQRSDEPEEFVSHIHTLTPSYKNIQEAVLSLGGTSVASIMRVAWGCLLLMYLETDAVVFAETFSNRLDDPVLADVVGPLTSILPVPFRATGSIREVLGARSQIQRDSRAHKFIPGRVVRKLLGRGDHQSLYPALFNFIPASSSDDCEIASTRIWKKMPDLLSLTVEHPLALNVAQTISNTVQIEIVGSQNIISAGHLAILARQVEAFVVAMLKMPDQPIMQLSSYFPQDLLSVTAVNFSKEVESARELDPNFWVDHYALSHPHWPAVEVFSSIGADESHHRTWSFAELQLAYKGVASFISRSGHHQKMIAVCLDRRIEAYAVILGILASGNVYLPIDEELPEERKSFLLSDSQAVMLFTTTSLALTFSKKNLGSHIILVDNDSWMGPMPDGNPGSMTRHSQPSDNAYLLYTSGSTGVPKGVLVGRGNLCSFVEGLSEYICPLIPGMKDLPGRGKYLGLASRAFDVHIAEMFLAWRQGLAAVTAPRALLLDNLELALCTLKITHASFVPSLIDQAGLNPASLPDLHYLGVGGEKMSNHAAKTWASNENAALVNAYGPTEMSIGCTAAEVTPNSNLRDIGRPYGNSTAHVLIPGSDHYTLRGVAGELCFTGDLVANGYYNRANAKGFVNDFHAGRIYRTGDIVRLMADDSLEYLRREDDQTKVRGQRLELGEISEAVRSAAAASSGSPRVDVSTMIVKHPQLPRPQLVTFVVVQRQQNDKSESLEIRRGPKDRAFTGDIQRHCARILPSYMVPDLILPLTRLPIAVTSGKTDLKRLKVLFTDLPLDDIVNQTCKDRSDVGLRDLTSAERTVQSIVVDTLAIGEVQLSFDTNLFQLGLDSLSAINLSIKMQRLGYDCTVTGVLTNPTLEQLALLPRKNTDGDRLVERIEQIRSDIAGIQARFLSRHSGGLSGSPVHAVKPCLPLQETLVAASIDSKNDSLYVNYLRLELSQSIDLARLHKAWNSIVESHEILRTCFHSFEDGFVQVVLKYDKTLATLWEEVMTPDPVSASINMQRNLACCFMSDVDRSPPLKLTLFRASSDRQSSIVLFQIHHALYDRESFTMILEELSKQYHGLPVPIHSPIDSMIEYIWSQDQEASKSFWRHYLRQYKPFAIKDRTRSINGKFDHQDSLTTNWLLTTPLVELEEFAASIGGTLTTIIQAVFGIILSQTLETQDVVFGAVLSGRTVPIENPQSIVAPCLTTIPQRVSCNTGSSSITDIIKITQTGFVESLEYQHTPLRLIHRWLEVDRPLFDCLVTCVKKQLPKAESDAQLWTELEDSMVNDEHFALSVEFEADHGSNQLHAHCSSASAFGGAVKVNTFLESIDILLGALVRQEQITIGDKGMSDGKSVDRQSGLKVWDESEWNAIELKIKEIITHMCIIGAGDVSKNVSFFQLGIDSITAIQLARRLRESHIECSSADVMRHTCIGALAQHLQNQTTCTSNSPKPIHQSQKIDSQRISDIPLLGPDDTITNTYHCTPLQSSMLTQTLGTDGRLYANHHIVRLSDAVDLSRLKGTVQDLVDRTEVLRTSFHFSNPSSSWLAAVHQRYSSRWTEQGMIGEISETLATITETFKFHDETSFSDPPWKSTLLKGSTEAVLVISMHHSLYDGVSIQLLFDDLARIYKGTDVPIRPPFSSAAQAIASSATDAEGFWGRKLRGFEGNFTTPLHPAMDQGMVELERAVNMSRENISHCCKMLGVTIQTVALLAYAKALASLFGRHEVVFGHVVGGRSLAVPDADDIIGPLFNTVPSRVLLDKTYRTNASMAAEIQECSGESQIHQQASLSKIQQVWRQKAKGPDAQLLNALFVFQHNTNDKILDHSLWAPIDTSEVLASTEYSINLEIEQTENAIVFRVVARKAFIGEERLLAWLTELDDIFQDILEQPSRSVLAFPVSLQGLPFKAPSGKSELPHRDAIEPGADLDCIQSALSQVSHIPVSSITTGVSIFSLGLDSIAAIHVAAACRKRGYDVSVADVLQGRSLGGICTRLRAKSMGTSNTITQHSKLLVSPKSKKKALDILGLSERDVEHVLPCLAGQVYHLAAWLKSGRTQCEGVFTYQTSKRINADFLSSAWKGLRDRHPILRTTFVAVSPTEAIQVILAPSALNDTFQYTRFSETYHREGQPDVDRQAKRPFTLFIPPSALHLVRDDSGCHISLMMHHAMYDAWTIPKIVSDLEHFYQAQRSNSQVRPKNDLASPPSFKAFIQYTIRSLEIDSEERYWRKSLEDCKQTNLEERPPTQSSEWISPSVLVPFKAAITDIRSAEATCQVSSTSVSILILLSFGRTLARHASVTHPTFGLYQTGRSASFVGIEHLCAPCLNVTPVCVQNALESSPTESAQRLQTDLSERVPFEQSHLSRILKHIQCDANKPLFNTYVNILPTQQRPRPLDPSLDPDRPEDIKALFTNHPLPESDVKSESFLPNKEARRPTSETSATTALDGLDTTYLAKHNLYLDVLRRDGEDCIDFTIKCDAALMDAAEVKAFGHEIGQEIHKVLDIIQGEHDNGL